MVDDRPEDTGPLPEQGRAKREPPTIDLEATEVSSDTQKAAAAEEPGPIRAAARGVERFPPAIIAAPSPAPAPPRWCSAPRWLAGWPAPMRRQPPLPGQSQVNSAAIDDLAARLAGVESRVSKPAAAAPDPAAAARAEALEKSLAALRGELANQRTQSDKLASAISEAKSAPREARSAAGSVRDQRTYRPDRTRRAGAERRDHEGSAASRPTMCRCAASWRRPCSTFWSGPAIPIPRRWVLRKPLRPIRMP